MFKGLCTGTHFWLVTVKILWFFLSIGKQIRKCPAVYISFHRRLKKICHKNNNNTSSPSCRCRGLLTFMRRRPLYWCARYYFKTNMNENIYLIVPKSMMKVSRPIGRMSLAERSLVTSYKANYSKRVINIESQWPIGQVLLFWRNLSDLWTLNLRPSST